jgi:hypothetical protein
MDVVVRHVLAGIRAPMIPASSKRPSGQKEERVMAEKRITPKAPEKSDSSAAKTAAARVSKMKFAKKTLAKKTLAK